jgi:hypothetical protein
MITHLTDVELLSRIRAKLALGVLPRRSPLETFGGPSSGQHCCACGERIAAAEAEIEVYAGDAKHRFFHVRCFHLLTLERAQSDN